MTDATSAQLDQLRGTLDRHTIAIDKILEYVDKSLHVSSTHFDAYQQRVGRPYYPLDDGWALTFLDSGQPFFVNTRDRNLTPWIIMGGHWEPNVSASLLQYAQPGMNVLDIGAHIGYYTTKLGTKIGSGGCLWAFEPNPAVGDVCQENIKINGLAGSVKLHALALGDKSDWLDLTYSKSNMTSANLLGEQQADVSIKVEVKRLDDVLPRDVVVDLIKLDAEGYEKFILDGARDLLSRSPNCAIMIELGLDRWERVSSLDQLIPTCGGNKIVYAVQPDGSVRPMDVSEMRGFLLGCGYHENYFLIAPRALAEKYIGNLIQS